MNMKIKLSLTLLLCTIGMVWAGTSIWTLRSTPTSEVFNGITSPNNSFAIAVGENGTIVHFNDGDNGTLMPSGTTEELFDVYASSPQMAIATGEDVVLLWDGQSWSTLFTGDTNTFYTGTWIPPEEDVLFYQSLGQFNFICPYFPNEVNQPFCRGYQQPMITACGNSNDIKLLMSSGDIEHVDNFLSELTNNAPLHDEPIPLFLTAIWAPEWACIPGSIEPLELFAIRNGNQFWHFDGSEWSNMNVTVPGDQTLTWLSGTSTNSIIATGFKPNNMGGNDGVIWIYDGLNWTEDTDLPAGTPGLTDIIANIDRPDFIFASGFESITLTQKMMGDQPSVDVLAAAEQGRFLYTPSLFPSSLSDLSMSKRLLTPEPIRQGQRITFQLVVQNNGPNTATDFRLLDGYRNELQLAVDNCGMTEFNALAGWRYRDVRIPTLAQGDVFFCTMEFDVVGPVDEEIRNYAAVAEAAETNLSNNRSDVRGVEIHAPL